MLDVLVVDDDDIVRKSVAEALEAAGHRTTQASDGEMALSIVAARAFDVAVCDVHMPKLDGLALCRRLRREAPATELVIMTSYGNISDAVASLRDGVVDYIGKPFDPDDFAANVVGPIAERKAHRKKFQEARASFIGRQVGATLVGTSLAMRQLADGIALASKTDASVLIHGERGTGKNLVARTIHAESPRREGPFVVVPCAGLPELIFSSELRELAEMRARNHRDEWFRSAVGGTLVLDGVEQLSRDAEESLLRILDEPSLHARRSRDWQPLGVRVLSIANDEPGDASPQPYLDGPLHMRINGVDLRVPPVREREGDLYALASHFLHLLTPPGRAPMGLTPRAWQVLAARALPGNVRELGWVIEHALALADGREIDVQHLPEAVPAARVSGTGRDVTGSSPW